MTVIFPTTLLLKQALMSELSLLICTWNVGNKAPPMYLDPLVPKGGGGYDLIIFGCQEATYNKEFSNPGDNLEEDIEEKKDEECVTPMSPGSEMSPLTSPIKEVIVTSSEGGRQKKRKEKRPRVSSGVGVKESFKFFDRVKSTVGDKYTVVSSRTLLQMGLIVLATSSMMKRISEVETADEATGVLGMVGNKGGLVIKFVIDRSTSVAFCSTHLAAHSGEKFRLTRNANTQEILQGARVGNKSVDFASQFTHVFWIGDMNYRIDLGHPEVSKNLKIDNLSKDSEFAYVKKLIDGGDIGELVSRDELQFEIENHRALSGFVEGEKKFLPTFKVERRAGLFYKKQRTPSYCDRILWKSIPAFQRDLRQECYSSCEDLPTSDHKPVFAVFKLMPHRQIPVNHNIRDGPILKFQDVKCADILPADMNGLSDPYISFCSYPANLFVENPLKPPTSSTIMANLNPVYADDQLPTLFPGLNKREDLKDCHLILAIMDYDITNEDDLLGTVIFSFSTLMDSTASGAIFEFHNEPIVSHGRSHGKISGCIRVIWPEDIDYSMNNARSTKQKGGKPGKCILS